MKKLPKIMFLLFGLSVFTLAQSGAPSACPEIEVTGPAGLTQPGERMTFTVNGIPQSLDKLEYKWTISAGTIVDGQGKPHLTVETTREMSFSNVAATVEVSGLAAGCKNSTSLVAGVAPVCVLPITLDEWESLSIREEMGRLEIARTELLQRPDHDLLFMIGYTSKTSRQIVQQRIDRIRRHLVAKRKLPNDRIHFVHHPGERLYTRIYLAPKDAVESFK